MYESFDEVDKDRVKDDIRNLERRLERAIDDNWEVNTRLEKLERQLQKVAVALISGD